MYFSTALAAAASLALANAITIPVSVGWNNTLTFSPSDIKAAVGDHVQFNFFAKNHSVIQSSFADPCHPLAGGFFSTFVPTDSASVSASKVFTVTIKDTKPIWLYCGQTVKNHCQSGMVAAINAPATGNTLAAFTLLAGNASTSTSPAGTSAIGGTLASPPKENTVTGTMVTTVTTTVSVIGGYVDTTYATTYAYTYTTDAGKVISTITPGSGSSPTDILGGTSAASPPPVTTSAKPGAAATGVAANGAMLGAVVLGALAML